LTDVLRALKHLQVNDDFNVVLAKTSIRDALLGLVSDGKTFLQIISLFLTTHFTFDRGCMCGKSSSALNVIFAILVWKQIFAFLQAKKEKSLLSPFFEIFYISYYDAVHFKICTFCSCAFLST